MENNEEEVSVTKSDEFYEKIEAPKFVDFTLPDRDRYRPDDRYWFCSRVGCDQKHEEELDPEAIYKNFVLRVMAARSPNVRLRKTLNKKCSSANVKCPQSAPAKSSKSRVSRLAMISSISRKISDEKVKVKPIAKAISTPNAKTTQSSTATSKALTTPRNRKCLPNPNSFRSVQNPKLTTVAVPKNRAIAKTLVFNSPKKVVKTKFSVGVDTSVKRVCEGMKKLDIASQSKRILGYSIKLSKGFRHDLNKPLPIETSSKKLKGNTFRGVLKEKRKEEKSEKFDNSVHENNSSDMEIDEKSRNGSILGSYKGNVVNEREEISATVAQEVVLSLEILSEENVVQDAVLPVVHTASEKDNEEEIKSNLEKGKVSDVEICENQPSEEIGHANEDKENASVSDDNRESNLNTRRKLVAKDETCENIQKKTRTMMKSTVKAVPEVKHKKTKPTNPKPFRLRTDERGILKEAILEKKLHLLDPPNEASSVLRLALANSQRRHETDIQGNEKIPGQSKCDNDTNEGNEKQENKTTRKKLQEVRTARKVAGINEVERRTKTVHQLVRPQGPSSTRKAMVFRKNPAQLIVVKETSSKLSAIPAAGKPSEGFRGRRPATIPRGPNFHTIHTPKSCTRQLVA